MKFIRIIAVFESSVLHPHNSYDKNSECSTEMIALVHMTMWTTLTAFYCMVLGVHDQMTYIIHIGMSLSINKYMVREVFKKIETV